MRVAALAAANAANSTSSLVAEYETIRVVIVFLSVLSAVGAALVIFALRHVFTRKGFRSEGAKGAYTVLLFLVAAGDLLHGVALAVLVPFTKSVCPVEGVLISTGVLWEAFCVMCLSIEALQLLALGKRDGHKKRLALYITVSALCVTIVQVTAGMSIGFGAPKHVLQSDTYLWCHLATYDLLGEIFSFYLYLAAVVLVTGLVYVTIRLNASQALKDASIGVQTRQTIRRSVCKLGAYPIMFTLLWLPTLIHRIISVTSHDLVAGDSISHWTISYFAVITGSSVGWANAIVLGVLNRDVRARMCCRETHASGNEASGLSEEYEDDDDLPPPSASFYAPSRASRMWSNGQSALLVGDAEPGIHVFSELEDEPAADRSDIQLSSSFREDMLHM